MRRQAASTGLSNMLELATPLRPPSPGRRTPPSPDTVHSFLFESRRRVLLHCQRLLADDGLPDEMRRKLARLAAEAEAEPRRRGGVIRSLQKFSQMLLKPWLFFLVSVLPQGCGAGCQIGSGLNWAPDWCPALLRIHLALRRTWL